MDHKTRKTVSKVQVCRVYQDFTQTWRVAITYYTSVIISGPMRVHDIPPQFDGAGKHCISIALISSPGMFDAMHHVTGVWCMERIGQDQRAQKTIPLFQTFPSPLLCINKHPRTPPSLNLRWCPNNAGCFRFGHLACDAK